MNKAVTDGIVYQPLPFSAGLSVWSSGDGTPGSDTYASSGTGVFVPSDADFGGSLEVQKTQTVQRVRYMGETPLLPGTYLRIKARVKAIAGPLPSVRISGYPGLPGGGEANVASIGVLDIIKMTPKNTCSGISTNRSNIRPRFVCLTGSGPTASTGMMNSRPLAKKNTSIDTCPIAVTARASNIGDRYSP